MESFAGIINGVKRNLTVSAPVENGGVYTNKYCPQNLLTGSISLVTAVNGEILGEFVTDCQKQGMAMEATGKQKTLLDVHIAGLMAVVMDHLARCGRLIFGDFSSIWTVSAYCWKPTDSRKMKLKTFTLA